MANDENSVTGCIHVVFWIHVIFSLFLSLFISRHVYKYTRQGEIPLLVRSLVRSLARGGVSNLIEIPLCEIVEKSSHAIAGACAKMELQEETRFAR